MQGRKRDQMRAYLFLDPAELPVSAVLPSLSRRAAFLDNLKDAPPVFRRQRGPGRYDLLERKVAGH